MKTELEYRLGEHGFFTDLVRMVTTISGVALAVEAFSAGVARPHRTQDFVVMEGRAGLSDIEMHFFPADVYRHILRASTRELRLIRAMKQALNPAPTQHPIHVIKLQLLMARLVGDAFVSYFERHVDAVVVSTQHFLLGSSC
jgi:hypothetical protein